MKTLKITKHFQTLAAAVAEAKPDLSYNEQEAKRKIADLDTERGRGSVERAFITEDNEVWYVYKCDIRILHKFEPFFGMITSSPFNVALVVEDLLTITDITVPKTNEGRNWFKTNYTQFGAIAA